MITYTIDEQDRLIHVRMSGSCRYEDLENHIAEIYKDPQYNGSLRSLFRIEEDASGPIMEDLPRVKALLELTSQTPGALRKWAVLMPSGFKRIVVEYFFKDICLRAPELRLLSDETTARAWLNDG